MYLTAQPFSIMETPKAHLLLVEDDEIEARAFRRALGRSQLDLPLDHVVDGQAALEWISAYQQDEPLFVVLDLNLPRLRGEEVLSRLRASKDWHSTVVFVLTSSSNRRDLDAVMTHNPQAFVRKDVAGPAYKDFFALLEAFDRVSELPAPPGHAVAI